MLATRVAKLTEARTPSSLLSLVSTRAAHAAQDIPETSSWTRCAIPGVFVAAGPPTTNAVIALLGSD